MEPKGTNIYDKEGYLYALTAVDLYPGDVIEYDTFEFVDKNLSPKAGDIIPEPIKRFIQGQPFPPKEV